MKYLLVIAVVVVVAWMLVSRARAGGRRAEGAPRASPKASRMARCAHCGLHLPASEALIDGASVYCSEDHRRLGPGPAAGR